MSNHFLYLLNTMFVQQLNAFNLQIGSFKKMWIQTQEAIIGKTYWLGMRQKIKVFHCIEQLMIVTWKWSRMVMLLRLGNRSLFGFFSFFYVFFFVNMYAIFRAIFLWSGNWKKLRIWFLACFHTVDTRRKRSTTNPSLLEYKIGEDSACPQLERNVHCNGPLDPGNHYKYDVFITTKHIVK